MTQRSRDNYFTVCEPLKSSEEALEWKEREWATLSIVSPLSNLSNKCLPGSLVHCHEFEKSSPDYSVDNWLTCKLVPRTIVCHDMKGGYLEDRFVHGSDKHEEYRFFHWSGVDIFIYFSHNFITIPPIGWINSAHLHGVKILGTLITEGDEGKTIWKELFEYENSCNDLAVSMVNICKHYGFDGYLLNVENALPENEMPKFISFVKKLKSQLSRDVPESCLLWYDSIIVNGMLKWQNELNHLNKDFFDICDGIFLNYNWTEQLLQNSVKNAGERKLDVYVGIDVFGRGCPGGGGFNSCEAAEAARKYGLSIAIFAPGWTHETLGVDNFLTNEYLFWKKLWKYLYIHAPSDLPFSTSFCQGFGLQRYHRGMALGYSPWFNLSMQQYQPSVSVCVNDKCVRNNISVDDSKMAVNITDCQNELSDIELQEKVGCANDIVLINNDSGSGSKLISNTTLQESNGSHTNTVEMMEVEHVKEDKLSNLESGKEQSLEIIDCISTKRPAETEHESHKDSVEKKARCEKSSNQGEHEIFNDKTQRSDTVDAKNSVQSNSNNPGNSSINLLNDKENMCEISVSSDSGCIRHYTSDAFNGGGCLKISKVLLENNIPAPTSFHRILITNFVTNGQVLITRVTKNMSEDITLIDLIIGLLKEEKYCKKILADVEEENEIRPVAEKDNVLRPVSRQALLKKGIIARKFTLDELLITERKGWKVRYYVLNLQETGRIVDISAYLYGVGHSILLGFLSICSVYFRN